MTEPPAALAAAVRAAADLLDLEEHRYVERFTACPNGCVFDYATAAVDSNGNHHDLPPNQNLLIRVAGPTDCDRCDSGLIEDDNAPWLDALTANLRAAAAQLDTEPEGGHV
jgi:hypothetical protein